MGSGGEAACKGRRRMVDGRATERMLDMGLTTPEEEMREKRGSDRPRITKAEQRHAFTGDAVWAWWMKGSDGRAWRKSRREASQMGWVWVGMDGRVGAIRTVGAGG